MQRVLAGLGLLLAVAVCAAAVLARHLAHAPLDLAFLVPYLEQALSRADPPLVARIAGAELAWDSHEREVELRARDVRLLGPTGEAVASLSVVAVHVDGHALLHGVLAPRRIDLLGPRLQLLRATGGVHLGVGEGSTGAGGDVLVRRFVEGGPDASLRRVQVRDGEVVIDDQASGTIWRAPDVDIDLERGADEIALRLRGRVEIGAAAVPFEAEGLYALQAQILTGRLTFERVQPADLAAGVSNAELAARLRRVAMPVRGRVRMTMGDGLHVRRVEVKVVGGRGKIIAPELPAGEVPVDRLRLAVALDPDAETLVVDELQLNQGRLAVQAHGRLEGSAGARRGDAVITASLLRTDDLRAYWPVGAIPSVRNWVTSRVTAGVVREVNFHLGAREGETGGVALEAFDASLVFDGLTVRYLDALPAVQGVGGKGTITPGACRFNVSRGVQGGLNVVKATVDMTDLDRGSRRVAVRASVNGPVTSALTLARAEPLAGKRLGIDPGDAAGVVTADVAVDLPLRRGLAAGDVAVALSAKMRDVAVHNVFQGWSVAGGDLGLDLRGGSLDLAGRATLEGAPITVAWHEKLTQRSSRRVDVSGRLDAAARAALGFGLEPQVQGPVDVRAHLAQEEGRGRLDVNADLAPATLDLPLLAVKKPAGTPATAEARLALTGDVVTAIESFGLHAGGTSATGRATRMADGRRWRTLDAAAAIASREAGRPPGRLNLAVRATPDAHHFVLTSDDAGALFRVFGPGADAVGGQLRYAGTGDMAQGLALDGQLELRNFTLRRSPLLARIATLTSVSGIASALQGGGIAMQELRAGLAYRGNTLTITEGVASGPSLSVLMSGTVERPGWTSALRGTFVPSYYGLNTAAGRVPVLGKLATGGKGEGIQAFDFTVSGPLGEPQIKVSLSSAAPGVLRNVFRRAPDVRR
ncbi:MAG TPA: AsmA-like C-terminal region-containing protein [Candidatus Nitrosopolaris sp.]|nr:AsmA-like C-terminal region-containing protein [Candidatus Nitrosopolaris sp.]